MTQKTEVLGVIDATAQEPASSAIATTDKETITMTAATADNGAPELTPIERLAKAWGAQLTVEKPRPGKPVNSKKKVRPAKATTEPVPAAPAEAPVDNRSSKQKFLDSVSAGDQIKVTVSTKATAANGQFYGAFLKAGPVSALLHFTCAPGNSEAEQLAFIKALRYKQELEVTVLAKDEKKKHLSVTLVADAKAEFLKSLTVGQLVSGGKVVSNRENVGVRISLPYTTAFMHVSEVNGDSPAERNPNMMAMTPGTQLDDLVVISVDVAKEDVRLSQRLLPLTKFTVGTEATGTIERANGGTAVLKLEGGVKGLVPRSKLTGDADETALLVKGGSFTATVESLDFKGGLVVLTRKGQKQ